MGRNINMYFIAVMEPVKQPVGEERTKKSCLAHARRSQPGSETVVQKLLFLSLGIL